LKTIYVDKDIKGKQYKQLIDLLSRECNRFAFVEDRRLMEFEKERLAYIDNLIADIAEHLIERKVQREWETTILSNKDMAYVYYFHLNNITREFLKEHSQSLFGWISPDLPEDLMFYKHGECVFSACSHEKFFTIEESLWNRWNHRF
jgi:hypothetical protein